MPYSDYPSISPRNYDFLWEFGGLSHHYCSLYVDGSYGRGRDFIWYYQDGTHYLFISKEERERASQQAIKHYRSFAAYEKKVHRCIKAFEQTIQWVRKQDFSTLSRKELLRAYKNATKAVIKLWDCYFWTEYFCTDAIGNTASMDRNTVAMGKLKYLQRKWINRIYLVLRKFEKEIDQRMLLPHRTKEYYFKEIISLLEGKNISIPERNPVIKGKFSKWKDITGTEARLLFGRLYHITPNQHALQGQTGNRGFYAGIAKVIPSDTRINHAKAIREMQKGDVLVSGSTGPELILACRKAGAIVTEEGGIISHAAIIARELGIPCVIGTRIATKVLRDGDRIEVNATTGTVKIIKKHRER
ncbi:MAG: hypothetical protein IPJ89_01325 [Candidatus Iainarchaeum archaeon]|uniref:PEP-utilising enzyme mobile domain-containing protein n=1 Tax=Candidatus Iainarchaeum sp. TaxID=3101447 RepID=A0A7T9I1C0_9ARCH|nr:MAG: hypothetical protein IPJ89_01325 [Candidatus Diapherotrites archaeon]